MLFRSISIFIILIMNLIPYEYFLQYIVSVSLETVYSSKFLQNIQNIISYEEIFTGSNYISYKHKKFGCLVLNLKS